MQEARMRPGGTARMRLGVNLGYLSAMSTPADAMAVAREADQLGFSVAWVAEAYGSDSPSLLGFIAARTERIDIGSAVMQIPARTPALAAMTAATLDAVSGGRFRLGLGVSGPQVSEGWHGVAFDRPLARTREYVEVVRLALSRQPLVHEGAHYPLPLPGGAGKALKLGFRPPRADIPIYLAAIGPRNTELAGEIADGLLSIFLSPAHCAEVVEHLATGRSRGGRCDLDGFDLVASVPVVVGDDPAMCAELVRGYTALYLGGMGSRTHNFYNQLATRMGFGEAAQRVQRLYLDGRYRDAAEAVPFELVDTTALLGPVERIAEGMRSYAQAGVSTLSVIAFGDADTAVDTLRAAAAALELSGVGG